MKITEMWNKMAKKPLQLDMGKIFKAYDVRGVYPQELDEKAAYLVGKAFVSFLKCKDVIVGRDMRISSPALALAFIEGVRDMGADAIDIGEVCTDATYFASGFLNKPAVMFTASHNPPHYNGLKFSKALAVPVNQDTGLQAMRRIIESGKFKPVSITKGKIIERDVLSQYVEHVHSFVDVKKLKRMKIAVDAGNGMAGKIIPLVYTKLPQEIVPLFFELDGRFPNHLADPSKTENMVWLQSAVKKNACSFGMAFDGDADRIFFVDEKGDTVHSSLITALISKVMLEKHPKSSIVYNLVVSHVVPETVEKLGGKAIMERVGHSFIKDTMRKKNALFGGEHSAHYYFKDNYFADSGIIASIILCEYLSKDRRPLSKILDEFRTYAMQEETSVKVGDKEKKIAEIKAFYKKHRPTKIMELDGLTVEFPDWWFNVRPSNTEPLLRLNMEAKNRAVLSSKKKEILRLIST